MKRIALSILFALLIPIQAFSDHRFATFWELSENQLDLAAGGRANSIAVNPINGEEMFVASDSGGLFKTLNGGMSWTHVPFADLPVIFTQSVAYVSSTTILVSATADFKAANGGGVWRSTDGGDTWEPRPLPEAPARLSAYEISVGNGGSPIAVATSNGVYLSFNGGLDWTHSNVFNGDPRVYSVLVEAGDPYRIYAAGPYGVRVATTNPPVWETPVSHPVNGNVYDMHAFGRLPLPGAQAFFVNYRGELHRTEDGGRNWIRITAAPPAGAMGGRGTPFARAVVRTVRGWPWLTLFFSNGFTLHRLSTQILGTPNYSFGWNAVPTDHKQPRDLAFRGTQPALLATNAGLHRTADGGSTWTFTGGGAGGYNALQVNEVKGQWIRRARTPDLYVGTQDNGIVAADASGTSIASEGADGFFIDAPRSVDFLNHSEITYATGNSCCNRISDRRLANPGAWGDPPLEVGAPIFLRPSEHLQNVGGSITSAGLDLTRNHGVTWEPFARFFDPPTGIARLGSAGDVDSPAILYQPSRRYVNAPISAAVTRLIRIEKFPFLNKGETVFYPAMENFGGLGFHHPLPYMHPVFAIDPGNAYHIIAPDVFHGRMMESDDGGENWHELQALTNDVTDGGDLLFRTDFNSTGAESPIVTAISFCPANPDLVLIGTAEGGIFYSSDNGDHWSRLNDTGEATYVTSFYWQDANTVYVGTWGRGLWKLVNRQIALPEAFDELCGTCDVLSNDGISGSPRFDGGAFVFEGALLGVRAEDGRLRELFVTSGSSVVFMGDQKDPQQDIAITVSDGRDTSQFEPLPKGPDGWIATGVVFTNGDELTGTVFAKSELSLVPPPSGEHYGGATESPSAGQPSIRLTTSAFNGIPATLPEETFELAATDFAAGASYEVLVDGVPMKGEVKADGKGSFTTRVSAPPMCGYHQVEVRPAGDAAVIDSSLFLVTYAN
jgi:photosystem II stability/assembly factor-like uncharacterized protein